MCVRTHACDSTSEETTLEGAAREVAYGPEREAARDAYVGTVNFADYIECFLHWSGRPARWKIRRLHAMWFDGGIPLVIDLDLAGSGSSHSK